MVLNQSLVVFLLLCGALGALGAIEGQYRKLLLELHNEHRANEGASNMNELVWDDQLEREAQSWANRCVFEHEMKERGENLGYNSKKLPETELIKSSYKAWFDEKNIYSYGQNSCGSSCHYTQLVWAQTRRVGCGMKWCDYLTGGTSNAFYLVCFYDPKGNMNGEKPYDRGQACSKCRDDQTCKEQLCSGGSDPCEDTGENCDMWANQMNQCTANKKFMQDKCALTCKFCKGGGNQGGKQKPKPSGEDCKDLSQGCSRWAERGQCDKNPAYMNRSCKKSCGLCSGGTQEENKGKTKTKKPRRRRCRDKHRSCRRWARQRQCVRNPGYMTVNCQKSCNACNDNTECYDKHGSCRSWAEVGECQKNPGWMLEYCKRSCGQCPEEQCDDAYSSCESWSSRGECVNNQRWMYAFCRKSCGCPGGSSKGGSCRDNNTGCARWAKSGECRKNPGYMNNSCKKSCNVC